MKSTKMATKYDNTTYNKSINNMRNISVTYLKQFDLLDCWALAEVCFAHFFIFSDIFYPKNFYNNF